jgi:hypothetical protein
MKGVWTGYAKYGDRVDVYASDYIYSTGIIISQGMYSMVVVVDIKMRKEWEVKLQLLYRQTSYCADDEHINVGC